MRGPCFYEKWSLRPYRQYVIRADQLRNFSIRDDAPDYIKESFSIWWDMHFNPWCDNKEMFPDYPSLEKRKRKNHKIFYDEYELDE